MPLRTTVVGLVCLVLAVAAAGADDAKKDDAKKEGEKLQGKWDVAEAVFDGKATDSLKGVRAVFEKDKLSLVGKEGKRQFRFTLDPAKKPSAIDLKALDGELEGTTNPAVYQLDGDTLKVCLSNEPGNKKRPAAVASKEGSKLLLMTFKRAKK